MQISMKLTKRERKQGKKPRKVPPPKPKAKFIDLKAISRDKWNRRLALLGLCSWFGISYYSADKTEFFSVGYGDVVSYCLIVLFFVVYYKIFEVLPFTEDEEDHHDFMGAFYTSIFLIFLFHPYVVFFQTIYTEKYGRVEDIYQTTVVDKRKFTTSGKYHRTYYKVQVFSDQYKNEDIDVGRSFYERINCGDFIYLQRTSSSQGYYIEIDSYKTNNSVKCNNKL